METTQPRKKASLRKSYSHNVENRGDKDDDEILTISTIKVNTHRRHTAFHTRHMRWSLCNTWDNSARKVAENLSPVQGRHRCTEHCFAYQATLHNCTGEVWWWRKAQTKSTGKEWSRPFNIWWLYNQAAWHCKHPLQVPREEDQPYFLFHKHFRVSHSWSKNVHRTETSLLALCTKNYSVNNLSSSNLINGP